MQGKEIVIIVVVIVVVIILLNRKNEEEVENFQLDCRYSPGCPRDTVCTQCNYEGTVCHMCSDGLGPFAQRGQPPPPPPYPGRATYRWR
jgi:hypothetical protein